jgi:thioredoxin 1
MATLQSERDWAKILTQPVAVSPGLSQGRLTRGESMATVALTKDTFEQTVADGGIVLVDFWASWCGPCRRFAPVYEQVSDDHPDIVFGKVDTEAEQELAVAAAIRSIPTLMAIRDGIVVFAQPGALPPAALEQVISAVRGLDMDHVRGRLAAQRAGGPGAPAVTGR